MGCNLVKDHRWLKGLAPHGRCFQCGLAFKYFNHLVFAYPVNKNLQIFLQIRNWHYFRQKVLPGNEIFNEYINILMDGKTINTAFCHKKNSTELEIEQRHFFHCEL